MNHSEPPLLPVGARRALRCLSLLLLPAITPRAALSLPRSRLSGDEPAPYLIVHGALALRFERPTPLPGLVTRPAAGAPPIPALSPTEATVAQANLAALQSTITRTQSEPLAPELSAKTARTPIAPPKNSPAAILPDDTRTSVRPEDFLPFFQIPGSAPTTGGAGLIIKTPISSSAGITPPPSSATYTQTPK